MKENTPTQSFKVRQSLTQPVVLWRMKYCNRLQGNWERRDPGNRHVDSTGDACELHVVRDTGPIDNLLKAMTSFEEM